MYGITWMTIPTIPTRVNIVGIGYITGLFVPLTLFIFGILFQVLFLKNVTFILLSTIL